LGWGLAKRSGARPPKAMDHHALHLIFLRLHLGWGRAKPKEN
jgi:hypothetical protein